MLLHGTCVALRTPPGSGWRAALLRGPSGAGKSDLALRVVEAGGRLVADDQTRVERRGAGLSATAPPTLAGLIEVRGIGILRLAPGQLLARARLALLVDLADPAAIERMPDPEREMLLGTALPRIALAPFEASAVTKLRLALGRDATT